MFCATKPGSAILVSFFYVYYTLTHRVTIYLHANVSLAAISGFSRFNNLCKWRVVS